MDKQCLDCGELVRGRSDKKFCNDQCRTNYNNKIKTDLPPLIKRINHILKQNRSILEKLNPDGKAKILKAKLVQKGFNFTYHTHTFENQKGQVYFFCYEYGYLSLEQDWFLLVKREE